MTEMDAFERRVVETLRWYADEVTLVVDPVEIAHRVAAAHPRRRTGAFPWRSTVVPRRGAPLRLAWLLLLLVGLLIALLSGMLIAGSPAERDSKLVLPPVRESFTCPSGTDPDEPGPVDQVRPPVYGWSPMAFDRRAGKLVALAVDDSGTQETWTVATWTFDVCTNTWTRMHPDREPPALVGRLVYDVDSDLTIGVHYEDWRDPYLIGNVWAYDLGADTWTEHGVAPTDALGFYDPVSGLVVAAADPGLWNYDVDSDTWTTIGHTTPREDVGFGEYVYDASVDRIIVYAGEESVRGTWLFDLRTGAWSRSGAETPVLEMWMWALPTMVYDEAAKRTVVAANSGWGAYDATNDRWEIIAESSGGLPKPTLYDPVNRRLIIFGGGMGDLMALDLVTGERSVLLAPSDGQPATSPEPRGASTSSTASEPIG